MRHFVIKFEGDPDASRLITTNKLSNYDIEIVGWLRSDPNHIVLISTHETEVDPAVLTQALRSLSDVH